MQENDYLLKRPPQASKLSLSLASTQEEVREVQRLRYKVFVEAMGIQALANKQRFDADEFDEYCDHLIVRDTDTLKVVGTYRLLSPAAARSKGRYYSEGEFDLGRLTHLRGRMVEAGRACIHPKYRSGSVIMLLWSGLADYIRRHQCDYLIGCASLSLADGGRNAVAVYQTIAQQHASPAQYKVTPHIPFPVSRIESTAPAEIPPLIKGYLRSGGWVCGAPAWDADFHSADLFMMLRTDQLESRYARHYLKERLAA